jgi:hypothetical protein
MHIEDIFEDLEAQFAAAQEPLSRTSYTENARAIELKTENLAPTELIAPIIGLDFIAGLDVVNPIWHIFPMRSVHRVSFHSTADPELPKLRNFGLDLQTFLKTLPTPCAIKWRVGSVDDFLRSGQLHDVAQQLLFIYNDAKSLPLAVPILALAQLSIESVDNLNGDF